MINTLIGKRSQKYRQNGVQTSIHRQTPELVGAAAKSPNRIQITERIGEIALRGAAHDVGSMSKVGTRKGGAKDYTFMARPDCSNGSVGCA